MVMKKRLLIFIVFTSFYFTFVNAQNVISLSFSAEHICTYTELDSIKIENITQGRDTVLYFPDTVLNIILYDIENIHGKTYNKLNIAQNSPNPFDEKTRFNILVPEHDNVIVTISDLKGRVLNVFERMLLPGIHEFDFYACNSGFYLVNVVSGTQKDQIKMISSSRNNTNSRIEYAGYSKIIISKYFLYDLGDDLRYTGYSTINNEHQQDFIIDIPLSDSVYVFTYENLVPENPGTIIGEFEVCEYTSDLLYAVDSVEGVQYLWEVPEDWTIISGQGTHAVTVNAGRESGFVTVTPYNDCGFGDYGYIQVRVDYDTEPIFNQLGPYCVGEAPELLPEVSINGVWGTWNDSINTNNPGYTTYFFTASNSCNTEGSMEVLVDDDIFPIFDQLGPYCEGEIPDDLPSVSLNGIDGSWNSNITTYIPDTVTYVFTASNACKSEATMDVVIVEDIIPIFEEYGPYCIGALADLLPDTSLNNIDGEWNSQIDTNIEGETNYIFNANNVCQTQAFIEVLIDPHVEPEFSDYGPFCVGDVAPALPEYSLNGILGEWDNQIETDIPGANSYTFTALNACESEATIEIIVIEDITPVFSQLGPYCQFEVPDELPSTSENDIVGYWNQQISTYNFGEETYYFVADNACESDTSMIIVVEENITPMFEAVGPYCVGETPGILPDTSLNGMEGVWDSQISTDTPGVFEYTFIADNTCSSQITIQVEIEDDIIPTFTQLGPYCFGDFPDELPTLSNNGIYGEWNEQINTEIYGITTYTFTASNSCESTTDMDIEIIEIPDIPTEGVHTADIYEIEWNWEQVDGATGYLYSTTNDIATSINNYNSTTFIQYGLDCEEDYQLYVWAYNECEVSEVLIMNESTVDYSPYSIGDIGPAGGLIFYDKGACTDGWRYLEAAPEDVEIAVDTFGTPWGCHGVFICGTSVSVGSGDMNTEIITGACFDDMYAAKAAQNYSYNGFDDWFLPSKDALNYIFINLVDNGLGDFSSASYWSSSEDLSNNAWMQSFPSGFQISNIKSDTRRVRAVRKF